MTRLERVLSFMVQHPLCRLWLDVEFELLPYQNGDKLQILQYLQGVWFYVKINKSIIILSWVTCTPIPLGNREVTCSRAVTVKSKIKLTHTPPLWFYLKRPVAFIRGKVLKERPLCSHSSFGTLHSS